MRLNINFDFKNTDGAPDVMNLYAVTNALLWIEAGDCAIFEYSEECQKYFKTYAQYKECSLALFIEEFAKIFKAVSQTVPQNVYDNAENAYGEYFFDDERYASRTVGLPNGTKSPMITFLRCGEKMKIIWKSNYALYNGQSVWKNPDGTAETDYSEFVRAVLDFLNRFFAETKEKIRKYANLDENGAYFLEQDLNELKQSIRAPTKYLIQ